MFQILAKGSSSVSSQAHIELCVTCEHQTSCSEPILATAAVGSRPEAGHLGLPPLLRMTPSRHSYQAIGQTHANESVLQRARMQHHTACWPLAPGTSSSAHKRLTLETAAKRTALTAAHPKTGSSKLLEALFAPERAHVAISCYQSDS
jgi:hypothetical protein